MHARSVLSVAAACAFAAVVASTGARAEFQLSGPITHENLSVYLVRGSGSTAPAPLTLEQAAANGSVKIYESATHPIAIENFSGQSVFVPFGALLKGGLQDQVAGIGMLLPPGSGRLPLEVFCVDPTRSTPRAGESPSAFTPTGTLLPWSTARLSMLSGDKLVPATHDLQQLGVWWSMDSLRTALAHKLAEPLEPSAGAAGSFVVNPRVYSSMLLARRSPSTTSLPLALENERLNEAQQAYLDAMAPAAAGGDVIGAVFAVDGVIKGAEVYGSHGLFAAMWPSLVRAYATEAMATETWGAGAPSSETVSAFLAGAQDGTVAVSETRAKDGTLVASSFVPKLDQAAVPVSPEATVVSMLDHGMVNDRTLASLSRDDNVVLVPDPATGAWHASIQVAAAAAPRSVFFPPVTGEGHWNASRSSGLPGAWAFGVMGLALYLFVFGFALPRRRRAPRFPAHAFLAPQVAAPLVRPVVMPRVHPVAVARSVAEAWVHTGRQLVAFAKAIAARAAYRSFLLLLGAYRLGHALAHLAVNGAVQTAARLSRVAEGWRAPVFARTQARAA